MIFVSGITASALTPDVPEEKSVKGVFTPGAAAESVYSVDIGWGDMEITYSGASKGTWNPLDHSYSNGISVKWNADKTDGGKITVTNHSNSTITAKLVYNK